MKDEEAEIDQTTDGDQETITNITNVDGEIWFDEEDEVDDTNYNHTRMSHCVNLLQLLFLFEEIVSACLFS